MTLGQIVHVVGARPNFMKAAPVISAGKSMGLSQLCIHTGQHYDTAMSEVFFKELGLPEPDINLGVGSGSHATQTAALLTALERAFRKTNPALIVVYGDVNSTLAAAIVASKSERPIAHVEAGLRSFDYSMPEEINRRVTDSLSELLFVTSPEGIANLAQEGVTRQRIHFVGNPMIDTLNANIGRLDPDRVTELHGFGGRYGVVTLHRPSNVDDPAKASRIIQILEEISDNMSLVFPVHPRGRATLEAAGLAQKPGLRIMDPLGYVDFLSLVRGASVVITDSGGIQEETTVLGVPCVTLRSSTERPITLSHGTNRLCALDNLVMAVEEATGDTLSFAPEPPPLWDGKSGVRIARIIENWLRCARIDLGLDHRDTR